jgi:hypothetical protein
MSLSNRRVFMMQVVAGTSALAAAGAATAQTRLEENDPQAVALGYKHDTTKVDRAKFPKHTNDQKCTNCQLFQGKATDAWGGCPLFGAKQVAGPGWCSAWVKKA